MINITVGNASPGESASIPTPLTMGYGVCSNRMTCHCTGYRGMNSQPCQVCGCGFGAHY
jgi:hypothetical protein